MPYIVRTLIVLQAMMCMSCAVTKTQPSHTTPDQPVLQSLHRTSPVQLDTALQADRTFDGHVVLFGNLHAHSNLSDDVHFTGPEFTPAAGFKHAHINGLDFLAITDHHKSVDSNHRLSLSAMEYQSELLQVAKDFNADNPGFVAIPALEWGNTATGNHINIIGPDVLPPDSILDTDYDDLFTWAVNHAEFIQFNHPNSWKRKSNRNREVGNFGGNLYSSEEEYVDLVDPVAETISIICTVKGGHISGEDKRSDQKVHRDMQWERYYQQFLNMGFHISPSANQDTHWRNWGTVTAARTAVWSESASYDDLMAAFRANRVYATEDDELAVAFRVRHDGTTHWMGDTVLIDNDEVDVVALVKVWQITGSDGDATNEGPYTIEILSDWDGPGGRSAAVWTEEVSVPSGTEIEIPLRVVNGEYLYIQVTEENGLDNPLGEGEDSFINATDERGSDGIRDDLNDSAWTSPIWFVQDTLPLVPMSAAIATGTQFVWSKKSGYYHDPDCWAVSLIGRAFRQAGPAPAGMEKHACKIRPKRHTEGNRIIPMSDEIKIAAVLKRDARTAKTIAELESIGSKLGMRVTGVGKATVSFAVAPDAFAKIFGELPTAVPEQPASRRDFGSAGGYIITEQLHIPTLMDKFVSSMSVEPPITRLGSPGTTTPLTLQGGSDGSQETFEEISSTEKDVQEDKN